MTWSLVQRMIHYGSLLVVLLGIGMTIYTKGIDSFVGSVLIIIGTGFWCMWKIADKETK